MTDEIRGINSSLKLPLKFKLDMQRLFSQKEQQCQSQRAVQDLDPQFIAPVNTQIRYNPQHVPKHLGSARQRQDTLLQTPTFNHNMGNAHEFNQSTHQIVLKPQK